MFDIDLPLGLKNNPAKVPKTLGNCADVALHGIWSSVSVDVLNESYN